MKLEFSQQIFEKSSNMKFHENLSSGKTSCPKPMDRHNEANSHFCNFVNMPKNMMTWLVLHQLTVLLGKTTNKTHDKFTKSEYIFYVVSF